MRTENIFWKKDLQENFLIINVIWILSILLIFQNLFLMQNAWAINITANENFTNVIPDVNDNLVEIIKSNTNVLYVPSEEDDLNNNTLIDLSNITDDFNIVNISNVSNATLFPEESDIYPTEPVTDINIVTTTMLSELNVDDICTCDLLSGSCDVNCCCDRDCIADDRRSFLKCFPRIQPANEQYCFKKNIIYINNTEYSITETDKGLFCIVHDNFKQKFYFKDKPVIKSLEEFKNLQVRDHFTWSDEKASFPPSHPEAKAGKPVFVINTDNQHLSHWWLPFKTFTNLCDSLKEIAYLTDMESSCHQQWKNFKEDCQNKAAFNAKTYYKKFLVLKIPFFESNLTDISTDYENFTSNNVILQNSLCERSNNCISIVPESNYISKDEFGIPNSCILKGDLPSPEFNESSKICRNVVTQVLYEIYHNGIHGIYKVNAQFEVADVRKGLPVLTQTFVVRFHWLSDVNVTFKRSGNPGYITGYPLLAGYLKNSVGGIILNSNENRLFTISGSSLDGSCAGERITVRFGENLKSGCLLKHLSTHQGNFCKYMQEQILNILLGNNFPTYVGVFGNADVQNLGDWVEIFHDGRPPEPYPQATSDYICPSIVYKFHIEIAFASVGSLANPQKKIIGVVCKYGNPEEVRLYCLGLSCYNHNSFAVEITTTVSFIDVSVPSVPIYAQPPVIEAKLPDDIFYPFLSSISCNSFVSQQQITLITGILVLYCMVCMQLIFTAEYLK